MEASFMGSPRPEMLRLTPCIREAVRSGQKLDASGR